MAHPAQSTSHCIASNLLYIICLFNPNSIRSYKNYLQNTHHVVLRNPPTLSIGTERLACLNTTMTCSWGPLPSMWQVPGSSPGPGWHAARAFFLHPPFLPPPRAGYRQDWNVLSLTNSSVRVPVNRKICVQSQKLEKGPVEMLGYMSVYTMQ